MQENTEFDKYGGWKKIKGKKTGFFHLEKINGRRWYVTPLGNVFMPVALSHPYTGETKYTCLDLFQGDYDKYIRDSFDKLIYLGFNCSLAEGTSPERNMNGFVDEKPIVDLFKEKDFPYTVGIYLLKHPLEFAEGETYPDIFSQSFLSTWTSNIEKTCRDNAENPLVLGYYYGFGGLNDEVMLIHSMLDREPSTPGREAILSYFVKKYEDKLELYNRIYDKKAKTTEDILQSESPRFTNEVNSRHQGNNMAKLDKDLVEDFEEIVAMLALHLYKFAKKEIYKWDKNHLILGNYLKAHSLNAQTWKKVSPYVDVIAPQHIVEQPDINEFMKASGLPCLVSDQRFGIYYPDKIRFAAVNSHESRAKVYEGNMKCIMSHPEIIGVSYCNALYDQYEPTSRLAVGEQGVYEKEGRERTEVSGPIIRANKKAYEWAENYVDQEQFKKNRDAFFKIWDEAQKGVSTDPARQWKPTDMVK